MQRKIFVDKDTTSAKEADCCITTLDILQTNICTNEISKLLDAIKTFIQRKHLGKTQTLFYYKFSHSWFTNCTSKNIH